eukprot:scaffold60453_cov55-Phaeocystis_antarctica.AAC.2
MLLRPRPRTDRDSDCGESRTRGLRSQLSAGMPRLPLCTATEAMCTWSPAPWLPQPKSRLPCPTRTAGGSWLQAGSRWSLGVRAGHVYGPLHSGSHGLFLRMQHGPPFSTPQAVCVRRCSNLAAPFSLLSIYPPSQSLRSTERARLGQGSA